MQPRLARLEAFEVPGFPLDYSRESLDLLEAEVLDRYPFDDRPGSRAGFTEAAMGYLGEALLNVAGGHWEWDEGNDMPVAHFDPELHLAPISSACWHRWSKPSPIGGRWGRRGHRRRSRRRAWTRCRGP